MNNEQDDNDTLVSATYRESAQETTPSELDDAVLRMAASAKSAAPRAGVPLWMKPVAWAATVGLTLAIVLDVTELSETAQSPAPASAPPSASIEEAFSAEDANVVQEAEAMARMRDGPDQPADLAKTRQEPAKRLDSDLAEPVADDALASRARGAQPMISESVVAFEQDAEKKESETGAMCSDSSREQAQTWYDCVVALRDAGNTAEADREMLELIEKFPGFQPKK